MEERTLKLAQESGYSKPASNTLHDATQYYCYSCLACCEFVSSGCRGWCCWTQLGFGQCTSCRILRRRLRHLQVGLLQDTKDCCKLDWKVVELWWCSSWVASGDLEKYFVIWWEKYFFKIVIMIVYVRFYCVPHTQATLKSPALLGLRWKKTSIRSWLLACLQSLYFLV